MTRRSFMLFSFLLSAILALSASVVSAQRTYKVCRYVCKTYTKPVPKGCNACQKIADHEKRLLVLESIPPDKRTWAETSEIVRLQKEIDDLAAQMKSEIARIDGRMDTFDDKLNRLADSTIGRFEKVETSINSLSSQCRTEVAETDKKGNLKSVREICGTQSRILQVKSAGGCGVGCWIFRGLTIYSAVASTVSLFNGGGSNGGPPRVGTDPPTGGPPILPPGPTGGSVFGGGAPVLSGGSVFSPRGSIFGGAPAVRVGSVFGN